MPDEPGADEPTPDARPDVALSTIAREWGRIGCTGFGGPPTHIAMLRRLAVERREWIDETEFEDAIAATNLLPGPASTQLAIFCAWRLRGRAGRRGRRGLLRLPGTRRDHRAGRGVPRVRPADLDQGRGAGRRGGGGGGRRQRGPRPAPCELAPSRRLPGPATALGGVRPGGRRGRGERRGPSWCWC